MRRRQRRPSTLCPSSRHLLTRLGWNHLGAPSGHRDFRNHYAIALIVRPGVPFREEEGAGGRRWRGGGPARERVISGARQEAQVHVSTLGADATGDLRRAVLRLRRPQRGRAAHAVRARGGGVGLPFPGPAAFPELGGGGARRHRRLDAGRGDRLGLLAPRAPWGDGEVGGAVPPAAEGGGGGADRGPHRPFAAVPPPRQRGDPAVGGWHRDRRGNGDRDGDPDRDHGRADEPFDARVGGGVEFAGSCRGLAQFGSAHGSGP